MAKTQQFKNKPTPYSFGQYYYENNDMDNFQPVDESNGVSPEGDKFSNKNLYSLVTTDSQRDYIITNKLRHVGLSGIKINQLTVAENNTGPAQAVDCDYRGYICDRNTFDCFNDNNDLKAYNSIYTFFRDETTYISQSREEGSSKPPTSVDENDNETCQFFKLNDPKTRSHHDPPNFSFLEGKNIVENLDPSGFQIQTGDYLNNDDKEIHVGLANLRNAGTAIWNDSFPDDTYLEGIPFKPNDGITVAGNRLTSIFSEDDTGYDNYIQIVIWLKSNHDKSRRRRFYVLKVSPNDFIDTSTTPASAGELANVPIVVGHDDGISYREGYEFGGNSYDKPAWTLSNLSVTFMVDAGVNPSEYENFNQDIVQAIEPRNPISENQFDVDFTTVNLLQEPFTSATAFQVNGTNQLNDNLWRNNFTPFAQVTINDRMDKNLQGYKTDDLDRQICSSPTTVRLKVDVADYNQGEDDNQIFIEKGFPYSVSPHYKVCVVHWNDIDDNFETVEDVFDKKPTNFNEVLTAQDANTFIFKDYIETFNHNYTTPGIKKIKILVFNYVEYENNIWDNSYLNSQMPPFDKIEPLRYKLLTSRIFLDIPISEFEDFAELGGSDYRTIPWPYTAPVIGGVSEGSKYIKSINDIMGGGKIGDTDIIDERYLLEARENNQLGKNIEKMDLEQVRYFDKSYDMNTLLEIPPEQLVYDQQYLSDEYLVTLPFPEYFEEFDINGDGYITSTDSNIWKTEYGRPDIADETDRLYMAILEWNELQDSDTTLVGQIKLQSTFDDPERYTYAQYWNGELGACADGEGDWEGTVGPNYNSDSIFGELGLSTIDNPDLGAQVCEFYFPNSCIGQSCIVERYEECDSNWNNGQWDAFNCMQRALSPEPPPSPSTEEVDFGVYYNTEYFNTNVIVETNFYPYNGLAFNLNNEEEVVWSGPDFDLFDNDGNPNFPAAPEVGITTIICNNPPGTTFYSANNGWIGSLGTLITGNTYFFILNVNRIYWDILPGVGSGLYWSGNTPETTFSEESSVGQIFIGDNQDLDLKQSCKLELNTGELTGKSIYDSSGNSNKGLLIGDYKVKKVRKGEPMRRDSFIKITKKASNKDGAL